MIRSSLRVTAGIVLLCCLVGAGVIARSSGKLPVPPFANGGITSLWAHDHEYIQKEFGEFELLSYGNIDYRVEKNGVTDTTWKVVAMGNYLQEGIQFATLARLKNRTDGILLIMFDWAEIGDSPQTNGVFYHSFIGKESLLIRTKQSSSGTDTLEFSCADTERLCGKCYFDSTSNQMLLKMVGK
ncbi:MAG: hypothetical protein GF401_05600 [Chitinivibrionales bacterium]|nr:hypothetical protein [Chitinivibrionales bacterium]